MKNIRSFVQLPEIKIFDLVLKEQKYHVFILKEFISFWFNEGLPTNLAQIYFNQFKQVDHQNKNLINSKSSVYLEQITLKAIPFTVHWDFERHEIRVYTQNAHYELFFGNNSETHKLHLPNDFFHHVEVLKKFDRQSNLTEIDYITQKYKLQFLDEIYHGEAGERLKKRESENEQRLLAEVRKYRPSFLEKITDFGLYLSTEYDVLRVHLLKYLAVLPSLDYDQEGVEVKRLFLETLRRLNLDNEKKSEGKLPFVLSILFKLTARIFKILPDRWAQRILRSSVKLVAKRFIAGKNIQDVKKIISELKATVRQVTLDHLGELVVAEDEANTYLEKVLELITGLKQYINVGERNSAHIYKAHVSIKVSALCAHFKPDDFEYTYTIVAPRLRKILITAKKENVFIQIDAEHYAIRNLVFEVYKKVLLDTPELQDYFATGIVLQCYLKDAYEHFLAILELAKKRKLIMPIRLVKGAYFDAETIEASANAHLAYQFLNKEETDIHYRQIIFETLKNYQHLQLCLASHNLMDHAYAEALLDIYFPTALPIEHQCLHMTYEALSLALANLKWTVRNYAPVGDLLTGMGYLVRRILENSSQVGILAQMRLDKSKKINQKAELPHEKAKRKFNAAEWSIDSVLKKMDGAFVNISAVRSYIKDEFNVINVDLKSISQLKNIHFLNQAESLKVIEQSAFAFKDNEWAKLKAIDRSSVLLRAQNLMLAERGKMAQLITQEAKKSVLEAYADVDEAIDFLNFYARENLTSCSEGSARGPIAVISPWNFPLAIPCGMVAAALVTGNSVILKSAEQTPLIAQQLVELLYRAGVPQNVLIHAPGLGEVVGEALVSSRDVSGVIFTGSKQVGTYIFKKLVKDFYDHPHLKIKIPKRVVTEMGGKNCLIVTKSAELDETIVGILKSAFNHSGQKCSALSRVLVDKSIKERLIKRLKLAILDLKVGESTQFSTVINPLISAEEVTRIKTVVQNIRLEIKSAGGEIVVDRTQESFPDSCVGPSLIYLPYSYVSNLTSTSNSSIQNEHFGPVLHITEFGNLDEAIALFNNSEYALTGGIYSQSQDEIDYVVKSLNAGNLYINRNITGARVGIEPFGGFNFSGTGPKAGGTDYLSSFRYFGKNPYLSQVVKNKIEKFENEIPLDNDLLLTYDMNPAKLIEKSVDQFNFTVGEVSQHLDNLFPFWDAQHKKEFFKFKIWSFENLKKYIDRKVATQKIAGQTNYNDYSKIKEKGIIVSTSMEINFFVFVYFMVAISLGCKIKIICTNKNSYTFWQTLADLFYQNGFSVNQIKVAEGSASLVNAICENNHLDFMIFDSSVEFIKELKLSENQTLPMILSAYESASFENFETFYELFFYKRTFAINLMRYGAPLIEGEVH